MMGGMGGGGKVILQTQLEKIIFIPFYLVFGLIGIAGILLVITVVCIALYFLINILMIIS